MRTKVVTAFIFASLLLSSLPVCANSSANAGRDPKRRGGADRGGCDIAATQDKAVDELMALVPAQGEMQVASVNPLFWFYSPYTPSSSLGAKFTLRDENDQLVGEPVTVTLPKSAGIFSVQFAKSLKLNTSYRWYFSVECDADRPAKNPRVQGWVRVKEPTTEVSKQLKQAVSPGQAAAIYARAGLWNDALTSLAQQHNSSTTAKTAWSELLKAEKLDPIESKPILPCCTPR